MEWQAAISEAGLRIAGHVRRTPVATVRWEARTARFEARAVRFKFEQMQHTGSFKARGAFNTLLQAQVPEAGIVAASGGNHGAAVACAAAALGHRARIYVPRIAGPAKIALIRAQGADLQVVPGAYAEAAERAAEWQEATGALQAALAAGEPVDVEVSGIAANALGAKRIGDICFGLAREQGVESVLVSDTAIADAQAALWREARQLVEPAGAAALAALMSGAYVPAPEERVAVLVCGGNVAPDPLDSA